MTENKLYAQCREEARKIIYDNIGVSNIKYDLAQLTAEIYGMKLLDKMADELSLKSLHNGWELHKAFEDLKIIGSTQQLHDHFVSEFKTDNDEQ